MATFIDLQLSADKFGDAVINRLRMIPIVAANPFPFQGLPANPNALPILAVLDHVEIPKGSVAALQPGPQPGTQTFNVPGPNAAKQKQVSVTQVVIKVPVQVFIKSLAQAQDPDTPAGTYLASPVLDVSIDLHAGIGGFFFTVMDVLAGGVSQPLVVGLLQQQSLPWVSFQFDALDTFLGAVTVTNMAVTCDGTPPSKQQAGNDATAIGLRLEINGPSTVEADWLAYFWDSPRTSSDWTGAFSSTRI